MMFTMGGTQKNRFIGFALSKIGGPRSHPSHEELMSRGDPPIKELVDEWEISKVLIDYGSSMNVVSFDAIPIIE